MTCSKATGGRSTFPTRKKPTVGPSSHDRCFCYLLVAWRCLRIDQLPMQKRLAFNHNHITIIIVQGKNHRFGSHKAQLLEKIETKKVKGEHCSHLQFRKRQLPVSMSAWEGMASVSAHTISLIPQLQTKWKPSTHLNAVASSCFQFGLSSYLPFPSVHTFHSDLLRTSRCAALPVCLILCVTLDLFSYLLLIGCGVCVCVVHSHKQGEGVAMTFQVLSLSVPHSFLLRIFTLVS